MSHSLFDFPPELIPPQLQKIANDCGQQTALALLLNFPGVHIFIPASPVLDPRNYCKTSYQLC